MRMKHEEAFVDHREPEPHVLLIGVGGFGIRLLQSDVIDEYPTVLRIFIDQGISSMTESLSPRISIIDPQIPNYRNGDALSAAHSFRSVQQKLDAIISHASCALIATGLGGGIGSGLTPLIANYLQNKEIPVLGMIAMPDEAVDGRKKVLTAKHAIVDVQKVIHQAVMLTTAWAQHPLAPNQSLQLYCDKVVAFVHCLCAFGIIPIDFSQIQSALAPGYPSAIVSVTTEEQNRAETSARILLEDPELARFIHRPSSIVMHIMADKTLSLFEVAQSADYIRTHWGAVIDLKYGAAISPNPGRTFRLSVIVGETEDPFMSDGASASDEIQTHNYHESFAKEAGMWR